MTSKDEEAGYNATEQPPAYAGTEGVTIMTENQPPSYTESSQNLAPPPSYESLFGKMKAAKEQSSGKVDLGKSICVILLGTLGCTICLALMLAIPITMIVIGAIHKDHCPAERFIPIYLIVAGAFGIVKNLSTLGQRARNKDKDDKDEQNAKTNPFDGLVSCFLFAWFIAGNVWIYRTYGHWSSDPAASNYCDPTLYYFAFWVTTATYILMGTVCCCICFGGILAACCGACKGE